MERKRLTDSIKTAKAWAKVHLKEPIVNKSTGFPIEVTGNAIDHTMGHDLDVDKSGKFIDLLFLIKHFKTILRDAILVNTKNDKYELDESLLVHEFRYELIYKGKVEMIQILVKEYVTNKTLMLKKRRFYNHRFVIQEIKKP